MPASMASSTSGRSAIHSIRDLDNRNQLAVDRTAGKIDAEVAGAQYEVEGFDAVIKAMVEQQGRLDADHRQVAATACRRARNASGSASRKSSPIRRRSFPTPCASSPNTPRRSCSSATSRSSSQRTKVGYQKANEFIRRFVEAGGILKEGSDSPRGMAGLLMHEALVMDVEAGVPPMTAIQAATINVAKTFHKDKDYGSVEPGKVADLSIIEGDPLQDIWMTQNVKMVVLDGKIVDPQFTGYVNPIPEFNSWQQLSRAHRRFAACDHAGLGPDDAESARQGILAVPPGAAQRQGDRDQVRQPQRAAGDRSRAKRSRMSACTRSR